MVSWPRQRMIRSWKVKSSHASSWDTLTRYTDWVLYRAGDEHFLRGHHRHFPVVLRPFLPSSKLGCEGSYKKLMLSGAPMCFPLSSPAPVFRLWGPDPHHHSGVRSRLPSGSSAPAALLRWGKPCVQGRASQKRWLEKILFCTFFLTVVPYRPVFWVTVSWIWHQFPSLQHCVHICLLNKSILLLYTSCGPPLVFWIAIQNPSRLTRKVEVLS